ncbi:MAG: hypothetical protein KC708_24460 [Anaerolineae bacterium]|nr:hypothetical protein [Anaerolineae bacterium]
MMPDKDVQRIVEYCSATLNLDDVQSTDEYGYPYLALCVIDAIFSIGVRYTSTLNTVNRFRSYIGDPPTYSIQDLFNLYQQETIDGMAIRIYKNKQRTSATNGILKAEAVLRVVDLLLRYGVENNQDMERLYENPQFEADFKEIPGQASGISLQYFYMLTGNENTIKPDRMVVRFLEACLGRSVTSAESSSLLIQSCEMLKENYPDLTPRTLDHEIWNFQRNQ